MEDTPSTLWTLHRHGRQVACLVRLLPHGIEVDLARDGEAVVTRVFGTSEEALEWAAKKRAAREAEGWTQDLEPGT